MTIDRFPSISTEEMVEDYYASRLDRDAYQKLMQSCTDDAMRGQLKKKMDRNQCIMEIIAETLAVRGALELIQEDSEDDE